MNEGGAGIAIEFNGVAIAQALSRAAARADDKKMLMEQIGASLVQSTLDRFDRETGPDGSPWPQSIRARVIGGKTLQEAGDLYRSITFIADPDQVEVGSARIYSAIHQFGGVIRPKNGKALAFALPGVEGVIMAKSVTIPARPYLGLDEDDRQEITLIAEDWAAGLIDGDGARA